MRSHNSQSHLLCLHIMIYDKFFNEKSTVFILLQSNRKHTLPARPSRTAATTVAQAPVPQARVAPVHKQLKKTA